MGQAFYTTSIARQNGELNWPDIALDLFQNPRGDRKSFSILVKLGRLHSFGRLNFNTTAYLNGEREFPNLALLNHRFFEDRRDIQIFIEGMEMEGIVC